MDKVKIVTDSTAALTKEEIEKYDISIVPLSIEIDGNIYTDGIDLSREQFVEKMKASDTLPKTSQPSIGSFEEVYSKNTNPMLSIHLSSGLSGTVNVARQAAEIQNKPIEVIDSFSADRGMSILAIEAAKMAEAGESLEVIKENIEKMVHQVKVFVSIQNLDNLIAGGRVSKLTGSIGKFLNVRLGITLGDDGEVVQVVKGRGQKTIDKFFNDIIDQMSSYKEILEIGLAHVDNLEYVDILKEKLQKLFPNVNIYEGLTSSVIVTHVGVGTVALIFRGVK